MSTSQIVLAVAFGATVLLVCVLFFVYERWYRPWRASQRVKRLRREEDEGIPPSPSDYNFAISFDHEAFTVRDLRIRKGGCDSMRWSDVHLVTAFKRDLWAVDCICLYFARSDDTGVEVDEEMAGWRTLIAALPLHLPGCREDWWAEVAFPAFAPNLTQIYRRIQTGEVRAADSASEP
jgi:hypothetical protein